MNTTFTSSAPGRLCLFGEHQDYLGLPVVAMAIDRRCKLTFSPREDQKVSVKSEALGHVAEFDLQSSDEMDARQPLGMALRELIHEFGHQSLHGWNVDIKSDIPIQAGCSSSTALLTAWVASWLRILGGHCEVKEVVSRCHQYEVLKFNGAGGDMDQFACGHGGLHRFGVGSPQPLHLPSGTFVLADSGQPKDTQVHLKRCRDARLPLMPHLDTSNGFDKESQALIDGTRINRDLESHWSALMSRTQVDGASMGLALTEHHAVLRDVLGLSTPRIESMLQAASNAGAWGGKINGSGGGGCAFVLCPDSAVTDVIEAMQMAGARGAWAVHLDKGVS